MRKHVPAERMNELKHVPAKLGESKLGSTATTRRVKQSTFWGVHGRAVRGEGFALRFYRVC